MNNIRPHVWLPLLTLPVLLLISSCVMPLPGTELGGSTTSAQPGRQAVNGEKLAHCSSSNDCSSGEFCRNRGDGIKLCMGDGYNGDYCTSSNDCGSGMFCRGRGDGLKVCMGNGGKGAFCSSGNDCNFGTYCKPRGDGYKVCM